MPRPAAAACRDRALTRFSAANTSICACRIQERPSKRAHRVPPATHSVAASACSLAFMALAIQTRKVHRHFAHVRIARQGAGWHQHISQTDVKSGFIASRVSFPSSLDFAICARKAASSGRCSSPRAPVLIGGDRSRAGSCLQFRLLPPEAGPSKHSTARARCPALHPAQ